MLIAFCLSTAVTSTVGMPYSGGEATPLVRNFTVAPAAGQGWTAEVTVVDLDGGETLSDVDVQLMGGGLPRLTPMAETKFPGTYRAALARAAPGELRLALRIRTLPGGLPVSDFDDTFVRTLVRGETLHVVGSSPFGGPARGADAGMIVGGAGAMLVVAAVCSMLAVRSRPPAASRAR